MGKRIYGNWTLPNFPNPGSRTDLWFGRDGSVHCVVHADAGAPIATFPDKWTVTQEMLDFRWSENSPHPRWKERIRVAHFAAERMTFETFDGWRYVLRRAPNIKVYP